MIGDDGTGSVDWKGKTTKCDTREEKIAVVSHEVVLSFKSTIPVPIHIPKYKRKSECGKDKGKL